MLHPVDRQGCPVDIGILPVNGQPEHVDMDIDPVSQEVWPVNMESCGIQAEWECQLFTGGGLLLVNTTGACRQAKTSC
jgi:hypothetical protein